MLAQEIRINGTLVERYIFLEVCSVLELNWREIAEDPRQNSLNLENSPKLNY